jgi:hypothetical protein
VTVQKYFSHPSLVIYFFATPPIKLKLWTANRSGITNNKPPGPIIMVGQSEMLISNHITFFYAVTIVAAPFTSHGQNNYIERNWHISTFLHPI